MNKQLRSQPHVRSKTALRAAAQDAVHHFTSLKRDEIRARYLEEHGEPICERMLDQIQPLIEEYDPVVELAIMAADYSNEPSLRRQANSDAAPYLRPKLSAVSIVDSPEAIEHEDQKNQLAANLVGLLEAASRAKKSQGS
jgi:hypothetical protein